MPAMWQLPAIVGGVKGTHMPTSDDQHKENRPGEAGRPAISQGTKPAFPANPMSKPGSSRGSHAAGGNKAAAQVNASRTGAMRPVAPTQGSQRPRGGAGASGPSEKDHPTITLTRAQFIAALLGTAVAVAVPSVSITSCVNRMGQTSGTDTEEEAWVSPYDWTCVVEKENGLLTYVKNGVTLSESGIDVSEHDGEIDWTQVKAAGVDFAMLRLGFRGYGQGTMNLDKYFLANLSGASAAGIKVGVYFFSQAITEDEAREEADYVINSLAATDVVLSYPIVFDEEPITDGNVARTDDLTAAQFSANALAFCQRVEQAGYTPMLYGNKHELAKLDLKGELAGYDVWYAEYGVSQPTGKFDFVMWQYSDTGSIPGVVTSAGQVDLNIRFLVA